MGPSKYTIVRWDFRVGRRHTRHVFVCRKGSVKLHGGARALAPPPPSLPPFNANAHEKLLISTPWLGGAFVLVAPSLFLRYRAAHTAKVFSIRPHIIIIAVIIITIIIVIVIILVSPRRRRFARRQFGLFNIRALWRRYSAAAGATFFTRGNPPAVYRTGKLW